MHFLICIWLQNYNAVHSYCPDIWQQRSHERPTRKWKDNILIDFKLDVEMWTRLSCLRIEPNGGPLWRFRVHKRVSYWLFWRETRNMKLLSFNEGEARKLVGRSGWPWQFYCSWWNHWVYV
jgi:hypothetical protein